jgi:ethanolamine utilization protein EutQ (cupin superfamily)
MAQHIKSPTIIKAAGNKPKIIEEFIGRVNSKDSGVSIARMKSPGGWIEPAQTPEFTEYTLVLKGTVHVATKEGTIIARAGEAVITKAGERVQFSTPDPEGAEYIAVCTPAFSPDLVHREVDVQRSSSATA